MALIFIIATLFSLTIGQSLTYEFADNDLSSDFYDIVMAGLPIAIILTLFGTIKMKNKQSKNVSIVILTIVASVLSFFFMINTLFSVGFITIENEAVLFRKNNNPNIFIAKQRIGQGALGEDGHRIVELKPFLKFWNKVTFVDTAAMDKMQWKFVNEQKVVNENWKIENGYRQSQY